MDVYLKKRWDLIPNLVNIVSGYKDYEENTLKEIINIRNNSYDNLSNEEKIKKNIKLEKNIILLKEAYPNILASDNFNKLSEELVNIEKDIENSRKYYNGTVRIYNNKVEMFPSNIFAKLYGYKSILMFETKDRENIKIDL
jgi:LemA protein